MKLVPLLPATHLHMAIFLKPSKHRHTQITCSQMARNRRLWDRDLPSSSMVTLCYARVHLPAHSVNSLLTQALACTNDAQVSSHMSTVGQLGLAGAPFIKATPSGAKALGMDRITSETKGS